MASCDDPQAPSAKSTEKIPEQEATEGAADAQLHEQDRDGFSDISDSELLAVPEEAMIGSGGYDPFAEKMVQPKEVADAQVKIDDSPGTSSEVHQKEKRGITQSFIDITQRKRKQLPQTPLEKYHMKYLWVTNLCSQTWCEQQMVYEFELPAFLQPEKSAVMNAGSSIHLARELEVHDVVSVTTQTREDSWAVKFLNILSMIPVLQSGGLIREFPVFGEQDGVFLVGVIDELGYSPKGELELRELKTRGSPTLPKAAQKRSHEFQVSLYKLLFDGMVSGGLQPDLFIQHLHLMPGQELGVQVKEHANRVGITVSTFMELAELTCLNLQFSDLPMIDSLKVEYCYQENGAMLGCEVLHFNRETVLERLKYYMEFWKGLRETQGVDIEEAWKCRMCSFANICEWRTSKSTVKKRPR
ncbi:exonuclease V [Spea bombifrons]|uniref:exonuclease V n=1 Tax=Spea bombifrons TaxID=233779 RepID=UPI00234AD822|nr:exonuclease V [Spea bombifrons]